MWASNGCSKLLGLQRSSAKVSVVYASGGKQGGQLTEVMIGAGAGKKSSLKGEACSMINANEPKPGRAIILICGSLPFQKSLPGKRPSNKKLNIGSNKSVSAT